MFHSQPPFSSWSFNPLHAHRKAVQNSINFHKIWSDYLWADGDTLKNVAKSHRATRALYFRMTAPQIWIICKVSVHFDMQCKAASAELQKEF